MDKFIQSGVTFTLVPDMCGLSARRDPLLKQILQSGDPQIYACHTRAVQCLLRQVADLPPGIQLHNLRTQADKALAAPLPQAASGPAAGTPMLMLDTTVCHAIIHPGSGEQALPSLAETMKALLARGITVTCQPDAAPGQPGQAICVEVPSWSPQQITDFVDKARESGQIPRPPTWYPWYPVIDHDKCIQCLQCLSFCLFDVYGMDANQTMRVLNSTNCKTNCPACARVCPENAILFPKHKTGPINGGESGSADPDPVKVNVSTLLDGDLYSTLRARGERAGDRFSGERDPGLALIERRKHVAKLAQSGDIPLDVLKSLPPLDELKLRAEKAAEKVRQAQNPPKPGDSQG